MLKDKRALVTGSTSGIGPAIARALVAEGADLLDPAAITALAVFRCGAAARNITGANYTIDGGWTAE